MHQLVILTALTATTGLFGGARHHAPAYSAPTPSYSTCANGTCGAASPAAYYTPAPAPYYTAPAPAPYQTATAPQAQAYRSYYYPPATQAHAPTSYNSYYNPPAAQAPAPTSYHSYYYPPSAPASYPYASSCPGGNCARR